MKTTNERSHNLACPCSRYNASSVPIPGTQRMCMSTRAHTYTHTHTSLAKYPDTQPTSIGRSATQRSTRPNKTDGQRGAMQPSSQSAAPTKPHARPREPISSLLGVEDKRARAARCFYLARALCPKLETISIKNRWLENIPKMHFELLWPKGGVTRSWALMPTTASSPWSSRYLQRDPGALMLRGLPHLHRKVDPWIAPKRQRSRR